MKPQQLINQIVELSAEKRIWIAYSGGVDSHVLLHLLATSDHPQLSKVHAIHIDHGLNPDSIQWTQHCADIAASLKVEFCSLAVKVKDIDSLGVEAAARVARYQAFEQQLTQNDVLIIAQHQQDQAETLLLQLFRGAGPKGLSAMASQFQLGDVSVLRPLIKTSQADILQYAHHHQLPWIDDPSNVETRWNRNYIRHDIWPKISQRWPSAAATISRSAEHCAEAELLLAELAAQDLAELNIDSSINILPISQLLTLSTPRCRNLLRHWINSKQWPLPSTASLHKIIGEVCLAKIDSNPLVKWADIEVRRYQDQLYFMAPLLAHDNGHEFNCNSVEDTAMNGERVLSWKETLGKGLNRQLITSGLTIRFRQGGEQIQPQGQPHHKTLKHLFQQWAVPPWQRDRIPLLYCNDELIAVVGYVLAERYTVGNNEQGFLPVVKVNE